MKWVDSFDWLGMERRQTEERSAERVAVPPYIYIYILIYYFNKKTKKGERETWGLVCLDEFDDLSIYDYWRKQTIMASRHLMCLLPIPSNTHTHQILKKGNRRRNVARSASCECDYQFLSVGDDFRCLAGRSNLIPFFSCDDSPLNLCFFIIINISI